MAAAPAPDNPNAAEKCSDLVQQAFVIIWERRQAIDENRSLRAFLFKIAYNRALNHFRDTARFDYEADVEAETAAAASDEQATHRLMQETLRAAVATLPERRRAVFELCFLEELTYREAAEVLGISIKTVEHQMSHALKTIRKDIIFFANRDAIRAAPGLVDMIIPVEWLEDKRSHERSKETVRHMVSAFRSQKLVVIFPSGRLAQPTFRGLKERPWMSSAVSLAQKYRCPIVPMHISGRSSALYYLAYAINTELRDMTLFRELLNKEGARYHITLGEPVVPLGEPKQLTEDLHRFVTQELRHGFRRFTPVRNCEPVSALHPCSSAEPVLPSRPDAP